MGQYRSASIAIGISLHARDLITTEQFLVAVGLESLRDLTDKEQLDDAGMAEANRP